jgi:hypothetical protein
VSSAGQQVMAAAQVRVAAVVSAAPVVPATRVAQVEAPSRAAVLMAAAVGTLLLWSISYLVRQAGFEAASPAAGMRAAVEGMALALAWLASLAGGCVMVLGGVVAFREPGQ